MAINKPTLITFTVLIALFTFLFYGFRPKFQTTNIITTSQTPTPTPQLSPTPTPHPMSIQSLRARTYPDTPFIIEQALPPGPNYTRSIASYKSDGHKIYGLLTLPTTKKPKAGFPFIIFLHGYIPPDQYVTTQDYVASQNGLAAAGFITFKPDLRGHGNSEGEASGAHFSEAYVVDTLNAISSLKQHPDVNPNKIGIWGHSNGGELGLRTMVISPDVKAGVFWAGVVGSFEDMLETHNAHIPFMQRTSELVIEQGLPSQNPNFWNQIDPYAFLQYTSGPIQLHHGNKDTQVPVELSIHLAHSLMQANKPVELYQYPKADHNLSGAFTTALTRTIAFFNNHL